MFTDRQDPDTFKQLLFSVDELVSLIMTFSVCFADQCTPWRLLHDPGTFSSLYVLESSPIKSRYSITAFWNQVRNERICIFMAEGCMNMAESGTNQLPFLWWKCFKQSISFWYCRGIESLTCEVRVGENPGNEAYYLGCLKTRDRVLISTSVLFSGFCRLIKCWHTLQTFETRPWPVGRAHNP